MQFRNAPTAHVINDQVTVDGWTDSAAYFRRTLTVEQAEELIETLEKAISNVTTQH